MAEAKWRRIKTDHGDVYAWGEYRAFYWKGMWELEYDREKIGEFLTLREAKAHAESRGANG